MSKLNREEISRRLKELNSWQLDGDAIVKDFEFSDFEQALQFMNEVGFVADKNLKHHPEWTNVYNKVSVRLTTHDADGVTDKDFELAKRMNEIASSY